MVTHVIQGGKVFAIVGDNHEDDTDDDDDDADKSSSASDAKGDSKDGDQEMQAADGKDGKDGKDAKQEQQSKPLGRRAVKGFGVFLDAHKLMTTGVRNQYSLLALRV